MQSGSQDLSSLPPPPPPPRRVQQRHAVHAARPAQMVHRRGPGPGPLRGGGGPLLLPPHLAHPEMPRSGGDLAPQTLPQQPAPASGGADSELLRRQLEDRMTGSGGQTAPDSTLTNLLAILAHPGAKDAIRQAAEAAAAATPQQQQEGLPPGEPIDAKVQVCAHVCLWGGGRADWAGRRATAGANSGFTVLCLSFPHLVDFSIPPPFLTSSPLTSSPPHLLPPLRRRSSAWLRASRTSWRL